MDYTTAEMHHQMLVEISLVLEIPLIDIDINASFVHVGGNSLSAMTLARTYQSYGIPLAVESILSSPSISILLQLGAEQSESTSDNLKQHPSQNLQCRSLLSIRDATSSGPTADESMKWLSHSDIKPRPCFTARSPDPTHSDESYPMTEMQLSLIYGSQNSRGTNIISHYETYRSDILPAVRRAWESVINSEPIFRTEFFLDQGGSRLAERREAQFSWTETMASNQKEYESYLWKDCSHANIDSSFQVISLPLGIGNTGISTVIWHVHHALIDGYSSNLVISKVRAAMAGLNVPPGPSFGQFARELQAFQERSANARRKFWHQIQQEHPSACGDLLLAPQAWQACKSDNASNSIEFDTPRADMSVFAQRHGITLASVYYAAWAMALSLYVGSESTVFGVVLSGRNLPIAGVERVVGPVINVLPFHVRLDEATNTTAYLQSIFSRLVELISYQCSRPEDGFNRRFSSIVSIQFEDPTKQVRDMDLVHPSSSRVLSDVPLCVLVEPRGLVRLNYHNNKYDEAHMARLGETFCAAITLLLKPHQTILMCLEQLIPRQIRDQLHTLGNCLSPSTFRPSLQEDLVTLFENAAATTPNAIAIEKGTESISYAELDGRATWVARHISSLIQPDDVVCVHADRSIQWIIAIYGILKARAIYSPFDESWPAEIRDSNFEAARCRLFVAPSVAGKALRPSQCTLCISVEELLLPRRSWAGVLSEPRSAMPKKGAYLCFTSGSTGLPKGVLCRHESLVAFQEDPKIRLFAAPGKRIAQIMSPAFDGSIHEIFSALSYGATLVLGNVANPFGHLDRADSAVLTPSIAEVLDPADIPKLSKVYLVGEPVPQTVNDRWAAHKSLYNMYGPTEVTCGATTKQLLPGQPVTCGIPNPSVRLYILNDKQRLVPSGVIGEIYISGIQVSEGYVGRPLETARSFLPDSVCRQLNSRMYKTGDYGYWNQNGDLVCMGRKDRQIKLRGFRLDLTDLEARMLKAAPDVKAIALVQRKDFLIAMVQPSSLDIAGFKAGIARLLPTQALPRHIIAADQFPLTSAGKVDHAAISNMKSSSGVQYKMPLSCPVLDSMIAIWREILGLASDVPIGSESDFVDLGGNSIQQMQLASKVAAKYGGPVSLQMVLEHSMLSDLAREVERADTRTKLPSGTGCVQDESELSLIETDWWYKYELRLGSSAFNVNFVSRVEKGVDLLELSSAWNTVLRRHRILSSRYRHYRWSGVKKFFSEIPPRVERVRSIDIWQEINRPFDLSVDYLITVHISADYMLVRISHIICDLTSLRTLLREVALVYAGATLPEISTTYAERSLLRTAIAPETLRFWSEYLADLPSEHIAVPRIQNRTSYGGASEVCKMSKELFHDMIRYVSNEKVTFHQLALAAVALALQHSSDILDIVLGAPFLGRETEDDRDTVGLFLQPLPIRIRYPPPPVRSRSKDFGTSDATPGTKHKSFVHSVQGSSQAALSHAIPWTRLLEHLKIQSDFPDNPLFAVMVTFHDDRQENSSPLPGCRTLYTWSEGAKFGLMTEFMATSQNTLLLRIEYDTKCFNSNDVACLQELIVAALKHLMAGLDLDKTRERLKEVKCGQSTSEELERCAEWEFFGVEMDKL